jgi:hypothetical protein
VPAKPLVAAPGLLNEKVDPLPETSACVMPVESNLNEPLVPSGTAYQKLIVTDCSGAAVVKLQLARAPLVAHR